MVSHPHLQKSARRLVIAASAASALLVVAACGSSSSSDAGSSSSAKPKTATVALTRANYASVLTTASRKAKSVHLVIASSASGVTIKASGDSAISASGEPSVHMTAGSGSQKVDIRLVDKVFYVKEGQATKGKFVKIDLTDSSDPMSKQLAPLLDQSDPAKQLASYQKAVTSLKKTGSKVTIDGTSTQPYTMTIDTTKLPKVFSSASGASIPKTITETIYVGSDNLPRRVTSDIEGAKTRADFSEWGEKVSIVKPPASQVTTAPGQGTVKS